MKFGHYWPKDPASEKTGHLRPWRPRFEMYYSSVPVLRFEPFSVGKPPEETRREAALKAWGVLFGAPVRSTP